MNTKCQMKNRKEQTIDELMHFLFEDEEDRKGRDT